jgi:predicted amidohydrolase
MTVTRFAAVSGAFGRDLDAGFAQIESLVADAREQGVTLLVLPEAALGGYLAELHTGAGVPMPPALDVDGPEIRRLATIAGDMVVCAGFCERRDDEVLNSAVCVTGDGVLGRYSKVHQPLAEGASYTAGDDFPAFDTPIGKLGMLICYDKAFPEAARALSLRDVLTVACLSAWPASRTNQAPDLSQDRWTKRFNLFDQARALENQVVWVASNQAATFGSLRFVCNAKVVGPGGDILATTGDEPGMAVAELDVEAAVEDARRSMFHLRDRRPDLYLSD